MNHYFVLAFIYWFASGVLMLPISLGVCKGSKFFGIVIAAFLLGWIGIPLLLIAKFARFLTK